MRHTVLVAALGLVLLPGAVFAQAGPQTAAIESPAAVAPNAPAAGTITRDQYIQRAQERAAQRAAARFDEMDANHDGVLDRTERRAWRSEHPHRSATSVSQPATQ